MKKTDTELKRDVEDELRWDPKVPSAQVGVTVDAGAVSLIGTVDSYPAKWAAEAATKRVSGVRTVAQDLTVRVRGEHARNDSDIAGATLSALKWHVFVPRSVTATVERGSVTLEGKVTWNYQREAAEAAVRYITGVVAVYNNIELEHGHADAQMKHMVEAALKRQASEAGNSIQTETTGGRVTLTGHVSSWRSIQDAEAAVWAVPGVTDVVDHLKMSLPI